MPILMWDASALVKRYVAETGTETVNALFASVPAAQMVITVLGCVETHAVLVRRYNIGVLDAPTFTTAASALQSQVIYSSGFGVLGLEYNAVLAGIVLVDRHHLNASDAAILTLYLRYAQAASRVGSRCHLVASDHRLLRAAGAEGLDTLNPELLPAADVPAYLTAAG